MAGAVLLTVPAGASAQLRDLDTTAVTAAVVKEMASSRSPGSSVAIVIGDRVVYERGFGVTNIERDEAVTPETLFRIGSVTKMFTGLTAALMAQRGAINPAAPIGTYARGLHRSLQPITLHQLLGHMGGIIGEAADTGPHDDRALGDRVKSWTASHTFAPPGDVYSYTGPGYWLAGYAIEQAGGKWYADLVTEQVLRPLGMVRSTFRPTMAMTWPVALDHRVTDSVRVLRPSPDDASTWPSGSLYSSARELSRFAIAFMNNGRIDGAQVIPPEAIRTLSTRQGGMAGEECGYTYGLSTCTRGATRVLSHYGFRVGSGAVFTMIPEHKLAIIVLSNRNGGIFFGPERAILDQLLAPAPSPASTPPSGAMRRGARAEFAGVYVSGRDTLRFTRRGDSLFYRYAQNEEARTRAEGDSTILILNPAGEPVQQFSLVRGLRTNNVYLHDGLSAFRKLQ
jgi:CubicO group peptidase (beta-lactamase class C family)